MSATDIILNSQEPDDKEVQMIKQETEQHPYFHAAALTLTHALYKRHSSEYGRVLQSTAISIPDRGALFALIEGPAYQLNGTATGDSPTSAGYSRWPLSERDGNGNLPTNTDRTTSLINHFLGTLPEERPRKLTAADASHDYMSYLLQSEAGTQPSEDKQTMRGQGLIDDFIDSNAIGERVAIPSLDEADEAGKQPIVNQTTETDDEELSPEYFTETMARIYIKQGKFEKASKIICRLNTKYPKKNRYFADQMRFLEKLMLNQRVAQSRKPTPDEQLNE